jgi:hypothetical protein
VNFDGTTNVGGFCTIRASFNVTTVADNGTGDYTVNFTTSMPDTNYCISTNLGYTAALTSESARASTAKTYAVGSIRVVNQSGSGAASDYAFQTVAVFR